MRDLKLFSGKFCEIFAPLLLHSVALLATGITRCWVLQVVKTKKTTTLSKRLCYEDCEHPTERCPDPSGYDELLLWLSADYPYRIAGSFSAITFGKSGWMKILAKNSLQVNRLAKRVLIASTNLKNLSLANRWYDKFSSAKHSRYMLY